MLVWLGCCVCTKIEEWIGMELAQRTSEQVVEERMMLIKY